MLKKIPFVVTLLFFVSCGGKFADTIASLNKGTLSCSMNLNFSSWQVANSPNVNVFPPIYNYAVVSTSADDCNNFIFSDDKNVKISLHLNAEVSGYMGQQLIFAGLYAGNRSFVASDYSFNFSSGSLNGMIIDSAANSNWKPPYSNVSYFTAVFKIPNSILGQTGNYPTGWIQIYQE
jgi:hypothetical protein